jgi:hypothetical protein
MNLMRTAAIAIPPITRRSDRVKYRLFKRDPILLVERTSTTLGPNKQQTSDQEKVCAFRERTATIAGLSELSSAVRAVSACSSAVKR